MQGQKIDQALAAGVADALPVPQEAKSAIVTCADIAHKIASGERVDRAMLSDVGRVASMLPIDPRYQRAVTAGLDVSVKVAQKKKVDKVLEMRLMHAVVDVGLDQGRRHLPKSAIDGLQVGMATAHAQMIQSVTKNQLVGTVTRQLQSEGQQIIRSDRTVAAAYQTMMSGVSTGKVGFQVGVGAMRHRQTVNQLMTVRQGLPEKERAGFDLACSLHVGRVTQPPPAGIVDTDARAGYYVAHGVQGGWPTEKVAQIDMAASDPTARVGVEAAMKKIALSRASWWTRLLVALGLREIT